MSLDSLSGLASRDALAIDKDGSKIVHIGLCRSCRNQIVETAKEAGRVIVFKMGHRINANSLGPRNRVREHLHATLPNAPSSPP